MLGDLRVGDSETNNVRVKLGERTEGGEKKLELFKGERALASTVKGSNSVTKRGYVLAEISERGEGDS